MSYFEEREKEILGEQLYRELFSAGDTAPARGVTVNTSVMEAESFAVRAPFTVEKSPFCSAGFYLRQDCKPGLDPWHHAGVYYVQEPSASGAAPLLGAQPGERVLDLCAAPGGKSAQLAAAMQGGGLLFCNEYETKRAAVLLSNLERMGTSNAVVLNEAPVRLAAALPGFFDRVLVDAPCSGEGMFRKEEAAMRQHSAALVKQCAALQAEILDAAAVLLRPGGEMVYSTCTFSPEEDEGSIGAFLHLHPEFELLPSGAAFGCPGHEACCVNGPIDVSLVRRVYPCHGGEGHFMARLQKKESCEAKYTEPHRKKTPRLPAPYQAFMEALFPALAYENILVEGAKIYLLPGLPLPPLKGLKVLRAGVLAGEMVKDRFQPHHHLFKAFGTLCVNKEELRRDEARTAAFLRGEEISAVQAQDGFCAVLTDGVPLGFGKKSGGTVKNHYPKGLRNFK